MSLPETRKYRRPGAAEPDPGAAAAPGRRGTEVVLDRVGKRTPEGRAILSGISFEMKSGSHIAVIGSGGSGKTTLLQLIAAALLPTEGAVLIDGASSACFDYAEMREHRLRTGYVFEDKGLLTNVTLFENVALPLRYHLGATLDETAVQLRVEALLVELEIEPFASMTPPRANPSARKRALLARALVLNPALLIIDEPQADLVPHEQELVRRACESRRELRGMTIVQADHDGEFGPLMPERVVHLESGEVKAIGAPGEIKA